MAAPAFSAPDQNTARLADPTLREALLRFARRRLPPAEVDDLVQNTLADALASNGGPADDGDFQRWVHGIARHKVADLYRRRGRLPLLGSEPDATPSDPAPATGELVQWIHSELPKTDGAHATLHWLLRESDGESLDEIARDAELPAPRVRQRVSRLRRHLHARWLALGAGALALLLGAAAMLHFLRQASAVRPVIARDTAHSAQPPSVTPVPTHAPATSSAPALKSAPNHQAVPHRPSKKFQPKLQQSSEPSNLQKALPIQKQALPFDEPASSNGTPRKPATKD